MTTDTLSKHIGAVASSATAVTLPTQNQGYVTKTGILYGSTLENSNVRTSWFCPSALSGATNAQRLDRLNELISILDCQTLDFDQDFDLDKMDLVGDEHLQHLALDGILLRSRIRYKGNGHIVRLNSAYTALSTRTRGNASQPGSNYDAVTNVEIYGFESLLSNKSCLIVL